MKYRRDGVVYGKWGVWGVWGGWDVEKGEFSWEISNEAEAEEAGKGEREDREWIGIEKTHLSRRERNGEKRRREGGRALQWQSLRHSAL